MALFRKLFPGMLTVCKSDGGQADELDVEATRIASRDRQLAFEAHFSDVSVLIMHLLARTTPLGRRAIVQLVAAGESISEVARRFAISRTTVGKWLARSRGDAGDLEDYRSTADHFPTRSVGTRAQDRAAATLPPPLGWQIAEALSLARSTVIKVLKRLGLARLSRLKPPRLT